MDREPVSVDQCYVDLLASVGIDVSLDEWRAAHHTVPQVPVFADTPGEPVYPLRPVSWDGDVPCFSRRQYDLVRPEVEGYKEYCVVEAVQEDGAPFALDYEDEVRLQRSIRPVHRYSRLYRLKRTLGFVTGCVGVMPTIPLPPVPTSVLLSRRRIYNHVRGLLRDAYKGTVHASLYYSSIPYIVAQLTGRRWRVSTAQFAQVMELATKLHYAFDTMTRAGVLSRHRFPKMQFVVLRLLQDVGVVPPYRVPWARTSIKRRQLGSLLGQLEEGKEV